MKSYRKAQGLSINTIIIAALGLAVLVILFAVFTGRIGMFNKGVSEIESCTQKCSALGQTKILASDQASCRSNGGTYITGQYSDTGEGNVCCCGK
ncbi:MAG TPA: hypothetical protein VJB12_04160 [Candidatus Nanoarchaeia archaeon]|nr:hypothetical protein [Candidatus Nanoarchaeia archaeon]